MNYKVIALVLALALALAALCGCGQSEKPADQDEKPAGSPNGGSETPESGEQPETPENTETPAETGEPEDTEEPEALIDPPEVYTVFSIGLTDDGFFEEYRASDYVNIELPELPEGGFKADEAEVQSEVDYLLRAYFGPDYVETDPKAIEEGDSVNIDYVGYVDGEAFDGGSTQGNGTVVTIGVTNYIEGFLDQLIGHEPGDSFDINVKFPDDYWNEDLAGKDAVFSITVNAIVTEVLPEFTDEMATYFGFDTYAELRADIEDWLVSEEKSEFANEVLASAQVSELPEGLRDLLIDMNINVYNYQNGVDYTDRREEFIEKYSEDLDEIIRHDVFMLAVCENYDLSVSDEDIESAGFSDMVDTFGRGFIAYQILTYIKAPEYIASRG